MNGGNERWINWRIRRWWYRKWCRVHRPSFYDYYAPWFISPGFKPAHLRDVVQRCSRVWVPCTEEDIRLTSSIKVWSKGKGTLLERNWEAFVCMKYSRMIFMPVKLTQCCLQNFSLMYLPTTWWWVCKWLAVGSFVIRHNKVYPIRGNAVTLKSKVISLCAIDP